MNPDIIIIGAGPIGLYSAIEAKLRNPDAQILLFERNKEYTRHHTLRVDPSAFKGSHPDERLQAILKKFNGPVPTSTIEDKLKQLADELGIKIQYERIDDPQALLDRYPSARTLVGADGAHSIVRQKLFDDKKSTDKNLQYIVEVKYHALGTTAPISKPTYLNALSQTEHFVSEQIGRKKDGKTPVSLFFFVDKATYDEVYAKKKKLKLNDFLQPKTSNMTRLANSIRPWLELRRVALKEKRVEDSEAIAGVELSTYCTKTFAKSLSGSRRAILLGDAGSGVPFNRAFNAGVERTILAAPWLAFKPQQDEESRIKEMNEALHKQVKKEITNANRTNHKVQFGQALGDVKRGVSKPFAGSVMDHDLLEAMQNARVERPSFISRNPRTMVAVTLWLSLMVVGLFVFPPLFASIYIAIVAAVLIPLAVVAIGAALFKGIAYCLEPNEEKRSPETLPWEVELTEEQVQQIQQEKHKDESKTELRKNPQYRELKEKIAEEKAALVRLREHRQFVAKQEKPHGPLVPHKMGLSERPFSSFVFLEEQPPTKDQLEIYDKHLQRIDQDIDRHQEQLTAYRLAKNSFFKPSSNKKEEFSTSFELKS